MTQWDPMSYQDLLRETMRLKLNFDAKHVLRSIVVANKELPLNTLLPKLTNTFELTEGQIDYIKQVWKRIKNS